MVRSGGQTGGPGVKTSPGLRFKTDVFRFGRG